MSAVTSKKAARQIRRAFGEPLAAELSIIAERSRRSAAILRRGFWGRMKWLLLGR